MGAGELIGIDCGVFVRDLRLGVADRDILLRPSSSML